MFIKQPAAPIVYNPAIPVAFNKMPQRIMKQLNNPAIFSDTELDRIIEMAWEDRTPFDAIEIQFGLKENQVRELMRFYMKPSSFRMWRRRTKGRSTKHRAQNAVAGRFKCSRQRTITMNKISKR